MREVADRIANGELGRPRTIRVPLLKHIHERLDAAIAKGSYKETLKISVTYLKSFYRFADANDLDPTVANATEIYTGWVAHLNQRLRRKELKERSVYEPCAKIAELLHEATGIPARTMMNIAGVSRKRPSKRNVSTKADKQNLEDTFAFGNMLSDLANCLSGDAIRGPLPIVVNYQTGQTDLIWCGLRSPDTIDSLSDAPRHPRFREQTLANRARRSSDQSANTRYPAINLRVEVETLIFIGQTGMNKAQAIAVAVGDFRYESYHGGYRVRRYKDRRLGEVEFEIYAEYREHFNRYLRWRVSIFGDCTTDQLFPSLAKDGSVSTKQYTTFHLTAGVTKRLGLAFVRPQALRNTRVNWLLRRSTDPALTAEMSQHTEEVLLRIYEQPHHQRTVGEVTRFWNSHDPAIAVAAPGPGTCVGKAPAAIDDAPKAAPIPDCLGSAGCLFCIHQRDVDSLDHVWSLASYRHLKSLELARYTSHVDDGLNPALITIGRATEKLESFRSTSDERASWVNEALSRVEEGNHHPKWAGFVLLAEPL